MFEETDVQSQSHSLLSFSVVVLVACPGASEYVVPIIWGVSEDSTRATAFM